MDPTAGDLLTVFVDDQSSVLDSFRRIIAQEADLGSASHHAVFTEDPEAVVSLMEGLQADPPQLPEQLALHSAFLDGEEVVFEDGLVPDATREKLIHKSVASVLADFRIKEGFNGDRVVRTVKEIAPAVQTAICSGKADMKDLIHLLNDEAIALFKYYEKDVSEQTLLAFLSESKKAHLVKLAEAPSYDLGLLSLSPTLIERVGEVTAELEALDAQLEAGLAQDGSIPDALRAASGEQLTKALDSFLDAIVAEAPSMPDGDRDLHADFVRTQLDRYLSTDPIIMRSATKPLLHAGDHRVMERIFSARPDGFSAFGELLNGWTLQQSFCRGIRARAKGLVGMLSGCGPIAKALAIQTAPAVELKECLSRGELTASTRITVAEQHPEALQAGIEQLEGSVEEGALEGVHLRTGDLLGLDAKELATNLGDGYDLVYAPSLLDQFEDDRVKALGECLKGLVGPSGVLILGNQSAAVVDEAPALARGRIAQEWLLGWPICRRDGAALRGLLGSLGDVDLKTDPSGAQHLVKIS